MGWILCSGIGEFARAMDEWVKPVAYCEIEPSAQAMLLSRMARGEIPTAPIWDDANTLMGKFLPSPIDFISAGFSCQDISLAGTRAGLGGKRSRVFWEIVRLTEECSPSFVFLENVWPGIRSKFDAGTLGNTVPEIVYKTAFKRLIGLGE